MTLSCKQLSENNFLLQFNQDTIFAKVLSTIYADLESLIKKGDGCEYNPDKLSTTKVSEHISFVDFTDSNITDLFKFKEKITGQTDNDGT